MRLCCTYVVCTPCCVYHLHLHVSVCVCAYVAHLNNIGSGEYTAFDLHAYRDMNIYK